METKQILITLANQIRAGLGLYISYDEIQQWPGGLLDELLGMKVIVETTPATQVICLECPDECTVRPEIETLPKTGETAGMFLCKKKGGLGLLKVPVERMRRWEIIVDKLKRLGFYAEAAKDEMISLTEAGKLLGKNKGTIKRWADSGKIIDNGETGQERMVSKASVLILKHEVEQKKRLADVDDLKRDADSIPDMH
ncbi:MAG: hypothetical protein KAJ07_10335 [Planctomycetes bacterium]|nr:hypothetical protein [Planctomycetota bacterium]